MRIAIIVPSKKKCGPVIVAADQIKLLVQNGHDCKLFYFKDSVTEIEFACEVEKISFKQQIPLNQYDIVHCHGVKPCLYCSFFKPLRTKTKFITTIHCYIFQDFYFEYGLVKGMFWGVIYLLALLRFDKLIALSKDAVKYYRRFLPLKKFNFLYNMVSELKNDKLSTEQLNELEQFKGNSILLGNNASLNYRKAQHVVMAHLPELKNCKLFLLGDGKEFESYRCLVKKKNIVDRVFFGGFRQNAADYLQYYDVFLFPSFSEGCPLALLEAASVNKKIVCSNIPVHREMFSDTEVVFFDTNNPKSIVPAIEKAIKNSNEQPKLNERMRQQFSAEAVYTKLLEIYNS